MRALTVDHVPESPFGIWFLGTRTWAIHVLQRALDDLERLIPNRQPSYEVVLDIGCGWGRSFKLLHERFSPRRLIGIDTDLEKLQASERETRDDGLSVDLLLGSAARIPLPDGRQRTSCFVTRPFITSAIRKRRCGNSIAFCVPAAFC